MNVRKVLSALLTSALLCIIAVSADAQARVGGLVGDQKFTAEIRPAWNMPSNGYYNGQNSTGKIISGCSSVHFKYSFMFSPESSLGQLYPTAYQGIGIGAYTFFSHYETGTPLAVYLFQGARLFDITPTLSFDYEWNLGLSAGWRRNEVVGSSCNILINVGLPFTWQAGNDWEIHITPDYTHFSNGDTTFPNGGANTFGCRVGASRNFGHSERKAPGKALIAGEEWLKDKTFRERCSLDLTFYGGWRADRIIYNRKLLILDRRFPLGGMTVNPLYRLNRYFSIGPSLDLMFDRSADIIPIGSEDNNKLAGYTLPRVWEQTALGLSARGEVAMSFYTVNIGIGYNMLGAGYDLKGLYSTYNLKAFLSEKTFINIGYRLSGLQFTHNLMLGFGFKLV